ncbi:MAG: Eco57I restriction-modification methylase domain-containing protein [Rhodanobacter sp.]
MSTQQRSNNDAASIKAEGAIYTPPELAKFVAKQLLQAASLPETAKIQILDPAMGGGALLDALLDELDPTTLARCEVHGYDTDPTALTIGAERLTERHPQVAMTFHQADFLELANGHRYDLVIANPPYVRTQVLGARQAQVIAEKYGLTGRVDLYYPFLLAIAAVLAPTGSAAIITSNRFLTTKSGQVVRKSLLAKFRVRHVFDLGDTKLFDAAVLPAITVAQGMGSPASAALFSSIYATSEQSGQVAKSPLTALEASDGEVVGVNGLQYHIRHGLLDHGHEDTGVWRIGTEASDGWLSTVRAHTWNTFGTIGKIRVGVKSTADKVFIRADWNLPEGEPELLMPLLTRHCAQRYRALEPKNAKHRKRILYPHTTAANGKRAAVDLDQYPRAKAYLESHREQLEGRKYVIDGGRQWFEIWVPQDPSAWKYPKLVFPDISEKPSFWMDLDGSVVNGECYFLRADPGSNPDLLWLALAVANSSFIEAFYDHCFNNKLYAGRRRWITQYVEKFPLPDPSTPAACAIIDSAKQLYDSAPSAEADKIAADLNRQVWEAFGLLPE